MCTDDFFGELYALCMNNWAYSLETIIQMLDFPAFLEYVCDWETYLYEKSNRIQYLDEKDRRILSECREIAMFEMTGRFRRLRMMAAYFTGNPKLRNEIACRIYGLFRKLYGKHILFVACFDDDIAFLGTSVDRAKRSAVVISDWFGESSNIEILDRIMEISFSTFSCKSIGTLYRDYLWAISRPYIRHSESRMYLTYGCQYVDAYEKYVTIQRSDREMPIMEIDRESTYKTNLAYYIDLYGDDYFIDDYMYGAEHYIDELISDDYDYSYVDQETREIDWTLLEMELSNEYLDEYEDGFDDEDDSQYESEIEDEGSWESEYEIEESYEDLSGMSPEEMLSRIRGQ